MGSVKRHYKFAEFASYSSSKTVKEWLQNFSVIKSSNLTGDIMFLASTKVICNILLKKELDCKMIIQDMCNFIEERDRFGCNFICKENLPGDIDIPWKPNVRGGNIYNSNRKVVGENQIFEFDVIHFNVGINYKSYHSECIRTMMINPSIRAKFFHLIVERIERVILYYLRDGMALSKIYECVMKTFGNDRHDLKKHLHEHLGYRINDPAADDFIIEKNSKSIAKYGMTFAITINFINLNEGDTVYSITHHDTVLVGKDKPAEILTLVPLLRQNGWVEINRD